MNFTKMQSLGNDYIVVDCLKRVIPNPSRIASKICDRRFGIGSDGLILISPSRSADFKMRMFNPDGSEAQMCGNGIRCIARYIYKQCKKKIISIETKAGVKTVWLNGENVEVEIGSPAKLTHQVYSKADGRSQIIKVKLSAAGEIFQGHIVSFGNPHLVIFVRNVNNFPVDVYGSILERLHSFPQRINIEFIQIKDGEILQRTWERGCGETLACGTGACAAFFVSNYTKKVGDKSVVRLKGGRLSVSIRDGKIYLAGPAQKVFSGVINPVRYGAKHHVVPCTMVAPTAPLSALAPINCPAVNPVKYEII